MTPEERNRIAYLASCDERYHKLLKRRYDAWCRWCAKFEVYWAAKQAVRPKDPVTGEHDYSVPCPEPAVPYPARRPSKKSKYAAYEACDWFRRGLGLLAPVSVPAEDLGTVREWRAVLVALEGNLKVKPLPKCNEKDA